ncbi:MAG: zincin-like metallopeptidase domain-containing protein [Salinisphaera sp.]|jgi:antirestriction protein ArdC|nr:zincin-like metallopeptidase domain-containing protein [Salinisphaera sp.]
MPKSDLCQDITNDVIASLEQGTLPWRCPWDRTQTFDIPINLSSNREYHGVNVALLWMHQAKMAYSTAHWMTYRQAQSLGGQVRKDEHSTPAVFYKSFEKETGQVDDNGEPETDQIRVIRQFKVFNLDQIDGIEAPDKRPRFGFEPVEAAERLLASAGIPISHGGGRAFYVPSQDRITMPDRDRFESANDYYATALHELTHATGHSSRCDRPRYETTVKKGAYAFEELVAERGSLFAMSALGLSGEVVGHDSYIDHWLSILREDKRAVFKAAAQAETAFKWLMSRLEPVTGERKAA